MTAPRAQEPLPCPHWQVSYSATKVDGKAVRSWRCECGQEFSPVSAPSADTRRLDAIAEGSLMLWPSIDDERRNFGWRVKAAGDEKGRGTFATTLRAALDAAMTQEGEAKQARESARWLADGPDLNEEGDA